MRATTTGVLGPDDANDVARHAVPPAFLTQTGRVGQQLAVELLGYRVGDQLPTVDQLVTRYDVGTGTVQKVLGVLRDAGCIEVRARGHRGTIIEMISPVVLWAAAGGSALVGSMPLPYSRRYEGLATGLRSAWSGEVELLVSFARGSQQRLNALRAGRVDFAVVSRFAAQQEAARSDDLTTLIEFPVGSYADGHELLFAPNTTPHVKDGYRLGIDQSSADQVALTNYEAAGHDVSFVEVSYMQLIDALQSGTIDCAVWSSDEIRMSTTGIERAPLASTAAQQLHDDVTTAVLVTSTANHACINLIPQLLDTAIVLSTQHRVLDGTQLPSY